MQNVLGEKYFTFLYIAWPNTITVSLVVEVENSTLSIQNSCTRKYIDLFPAPSSFVNSLTNLYLNASLKN
jgi:hypothetical protein